MIHANGNDYYLPWEVPAEDFGLCDQLYGHLFEGELADRMFEVGWAQGIPR